MFTVDRRRLQQLWPATLLCFLLASRWLVLDAYPGAASTLWTQSVGSSLVAILLAFLLATKKGRAALNSGHIGNLRVVASALAFGGASAAQVLWNRRVSTGSLTLALALTPIVVSIFTSATQENISFTLLDLLWPGLCGLTGLLLLFPQPGYADWQSWMTLVLAPVFTGWGANSVSSGNAFPNLAPERPPYFLPFIALITAIFFAMLALANRQSFPVLPSLAGTLLDALALLLSLFTLVRCGPIVWSSQFLLVPGLGLVESFALLRPPLSARVVLGAFLIFLGGLRLFGHKPDYLPDRQGLGLDSTL